MRHNNGGNTSDCHRSKRWDRLHPPHVCWRATLTGTVAALLLVSSLASVQAETNWPTVNGNCGPRLFYSLNLDRNWNVNIHASDGKRPIELSGQSYQAENLELTSLRCDVSSGKYFITMAVDSLSGACESCEGVKISESLETINMSDTKFFSNPDLAPVFGFLFGIVRK